MKVLVCSQEGRHVHARLILDCDNFTQGPDFVRSGARGGPLRVETLQKFAVFVYLDDLSNRNRRKHVALVPDTLDPLFLGQKITSFANGRSRSFTLTSKVYLGKEISGP